MEKKRIEYIDAIKGFAILLMVMGHVIAWNYADYNNVCIYDPNQSINVKMGGVIWQLIYSFHMPLFFMVSGFLFYKVFCWKDLGSFIIKKSKRLLIPWICTFGIVYFVRGSMGYWFLLCLFQMSIIVFLLILLMEKVNSRKTFLIDIILLVAIFIFFKLLHFQNCNICGIEVGRFIEFIPSFFLGVLLRKYVGLYNICIKRTCSYTFCIFVFIVLFTSRYFVQTGLVEHCLHKLGYYILPIVGCLIVFHAFANGLFTIARPVLIYVGRKSLPIYILHILFVIQIPQIGEFILAQNTVTSITIQLLYSTLFSIIAILLSIASYKIISASIWFKRILFGE